MAAEGSQGGATGADRHVPALAAAMAVEGDGPLVRTVAGTLCFADVSGFTALTERLVHHGRVGAEELVETLNAVFGAMLDVAERWGGMLLKFGGDALLFLFEADEHARRAASAAVEMRRTMWESRRNRTAIGRLNLSMSVGVHSGRFPFFLVGSSHRELVVVGSDVGTTIAAESAANAGQIAVSPATAALLPAGAARPRPDGTLLLRWRRPVGPALEEPRASPRSDAPLLPDVLAERLAAGRPEPEHRMACISFLRWSGTDALLEERGEDAVASALDRTIGAVQDAFVAEGVTLLAVDIDSDGGKVFAGSGVPYASEDDAGRMLRALRRIAAQDLPLPLAMGVNRGHVFVAEVGTARRAAYSAMGDTTNTAARIAAKAPPGAIYAHPAVLESSRTRFASTPVGPFQFKGKRASLTVYEVGEELGTRSITTRERGRLIGRNDVWSQVVGGVEGLRDGRGATLLLTGSSGMGKTRLLHEAAMAAAAPSPGKRSIEVLWFRGDPYGVNSPYGLLRDPVRSLLGLPLRDRADSAHVLATKVAALDHGLVPLLPLLGDVVQLDVPDTPQADAIDPRFRPDRVADVVAAVLRATVAGPLLLLVDDAQWADTSSAQLLDRLAADTEREPWLLLAGRRDTAGGFLAEGRPGISLEPLDEGALRMLVTEATEAAPLRPHLVDAIVARADGNPLFVEELCGMAQEIGSVEAVPDSLHGAMAAQIDTVDPTTRQLLRYASVLGQSFRMDVMVDVLTAEGIAVDPASLVAAAPFVDWDGADHLRFRNGLIRDAAYDGLSYRVRGRLHRAAGEAIERLLGDTAADALALHFSRAGDPERTWRYARLAADRARAAYANPDAAALYEQALEAARRLPELPGADLVRLLTVLGDVRERAGMFDTSLEAYRRASSLVGDDPVVRADLLLRRARARERAGAFSAALRELTVAMRLLADERGTEAARLRARLAAFAALIRLGQEQNREARTRAEEAEQAARAVDDPEALARALMVLELAELDLTGPGDGAHLREALDLLVEQADLPGEAQARGNLGFLAAYAGRWDEAVEWFTTARDVYQRVGDVVGAAIAALNLGEMLINQERLEAAASVLTEARRVMDATGFGEGQARAELQLARMHTARGEVELAEALLDRAEAVFRSLGQTASLLEAAIVRVDVRIGQPGAGGLELLDLAEGAAGPDADVFAPAVARARASALLASERADEAAEVLELGIQAARERRMPYEEALLLRLRARTPFRSAADDDAAGAILAGLGVRPAVAPT